MGIRTPEHRQFCPVWKNSMVEDLEEQAGPRSPLSEKS